MFKNLQTKITLKHNYLNFLILALSVLVRINSCFVLISLHVFTEKSSDIVTSCHSKSCLNKRELKTVLDF